MRQAGPFIRERAVTDKTLLIFHRAVPDDEEGRRSDIDRMVECLEAAGYTASRRDLLDAWNTFSAHYEAGWMTLPDDNADLLDELLRRLDVA